MNQAGQLQISNPQAAAWYGGKADREVTYLAPWVPFVSLRFADFTSARVGDYQYTRPEVSCSTNSGYGA